MDALEVIPQGNRPRWGCIVSAVLVLSFLAFISFPTNSCPPISGVVLQARTTMKGLYIALAGFEAEYEVPLTTKLGFKEEETRIVDEAILLPLMAGDAELNPNKIRFFDPPEAKKGKNGLWRNEGGGPQMQMRDSWGGPYRIRCDSNGDGKIADPENPAGEPISSVAILYSAGPDQDFDTWKDNVKSW